MSSRAGVRVLQNAYPGEGTVKAAIVVFDGNLDITQCPELTTNNIVVARIGTSAWRITLVSYYFEPGRPIEPYLDHLKKVENKIGSQCMIMAGDSNAKSVWWGSETTDPRGADMLGAMDEMGLQILNSGSTPTFDTVRGDKVYSSHIDITACSADIFDRVEDWRVEVGLTSADHNGISFVIKQKRGASTSIKPYTKIYNNKKANWCQFHVKLAQLRADKNIGSIEVGEIRDTRTLEDAITKYTETIQEACETHIPKLMPLRKFSLPWWSKELSALKREVTTRKRRIRAAAPARRKTIVQEYLVTKSKYEEEAKKAQTKSWKAFCTRQDGEGMWEGIYRVIKGTTKRQEDEQLKDNGRALNPKDSARLLARTFYPEDLLEDDDTGHTETRYKAGAVNRGEHGTHDPPFTALELKTVVASFNPKKAPGGDGLTSDICERAISSDPEVFLALSNKCLELGHFPALWKRAVAVMLKKPGKDDYSQPKSYRPIGLLPVLGKIFEKLVVGRLSWHLTPAMSPHQYGFRPQRGTEDALGAMMGHIKDKIAQKKLVLMVSLDIEGAFDAAWWPAIRVRLAEEKCPINIRRVLDSYLEDRSVEVRYAGEAHEVQTSKGCVQGSIGGPILWNLLLDPLLKGLEKRGDYSQAFADDVVLIFNGDTGQEVQRQANAALAYVRDWGARNKLKFAPQKTKAMVITRKLKYDSPILDMGGIGVCLSKEIKILGLTFDSGLTFNKHIAQTCKKAINVYKQLSKAARISWGLHPEIIRTMYVAVVEPIVTYAANVWAPAARKLSARKQLDRVQRGFAQKLCKSYRTVSLHSALILAGLLPLDLRVQEVAALYEARRGSCRMVLGDREVERVVGFAEIPHPAQRMDLEYTNLEDQQQLDASNHQQIRLFTDGSKMEGKVGAAVSTWNRSDEVGSAKLSLSGYCTVFQAELLAVRKATAQILTNPARNFGIYSDSRAALQAVKNHSVLHPLAFESRRNLSRALDQGKAVSLYWVKAHVGLEENERADHLAKEAAQKSRRLPDYDRCPVSYVRKMIRDDTIKEWNRRYRAGGTASVTKMFFPDAAEAYKHARKIKSTGLLTQILTGHGGFSSYLHRFRCKESPACVCDPNAVESVAHVLFECPVHGRDRHDLEMQLDTKLTEENIHSLMVDETARRQLIKYMERVCQIAVDRNK